MVVPAIGTCACGSVTVQHVKWVPTVPRVRWHECVPASGPLFTCQLLALGPAVHALRWVADSGLISLPWGVWLLAGLVRGSADRTSDLGGCPH